MEAPLDIFSAQGVSVGARLTACLLWYYVTPGQRRDPYAVVHVQKSILRARLVTSRGTLDRHFRELSRTGWVRVIIHDARPGTGGRATEVRLFQSPALRYQLVTA